MKVKKSVIHILLCMSNYTTVNHNVGNMNTVNSYFQVKIMYLAKINGGGCMFSGGIIKVDITIMVIRQRFILKVSL